MNLTNTKISNILLILFGCLLFIGCDKEDESASIVNIGKFNLLQESIDAIPYVKKNQIVFIDENQNETKFIIHENETTTSNGARIYRYDVIEPGDTIRYNYTKEIKSFSAINDSLGITFEFSLEAQPFEPDPESKAIADVLRISYIVSPIIKSLLLSHEIDTRTYPESFNNPPLDQKDILGETFFNVIESDFGTAQTKIDFNVEFGILSFLDKADKLWRLKEIN